MTAWVDIPNGDIDQDSPVTQPLVTALRDNPIAIAEGTTAAPVNRAAWHPFDMVLVGDGNDGVIYDFAVDGAVATLVSPDFEDGYEYMFLFDGLSPSINTVSFQAEVWKATAGAYSGTVLNFLGTTMDSTNVLRGWFHLMFPRRVMVQHETVYAAAISTGPAARAVEGFQWHNATAQKLLRARFSYSGGNINAGTIAMYRRRVFA